MRAIWALLIAGLAASPAQPASTVSPAIPAQGSALASAPIRQQFAATVNDINGIEGLFAGALAPLNPSVGQYWLNTGTNVVSQWNGTTWQPSFSFLSGIGLTALNIEGATSGNVAIIAQSIASGILTMPNGPGTVLSTAGSVLQASPSNPTGIASLGGLMSGVGAACTITPKFSTRLNVNFNGSISNTVAADGASSTIRFGVGTPPVNGAALTGTVVGSAVVANPMQSAGGLMPFSIEAIVTGLTPGIPVWLDLSLAAVTGGTASLQNLSCDAFEM
jgi:hypothetical protein